ncbi:phosphatidylinositol 4-kinase alpha 1, partial [Nicotiana attenuata]
VEKEKQAAPSLLLNVLMLLADLNVSGKRPEVVDMVLPFFIDSLEEGDASLPGLLRLRLQLLDAVARMASLGFEKSYREAVVLMTKSCLSKLAAVGSAERILLPAVAEICSDSDPTVDVEPSLLKLFRNLWFYVALFGLAPLLQNHHGMTKSVSTTLNSVCSLGSVALQAVSGPYMWSADWSSAVQRISQGTPPLVSSASDQCL